MQLACETMRARVVLEPPPRDVKGFANDEPAILSHGFDIESLDPFLRFQVLTVCVRFDPRVMAIWSPGTVRSIRRLKQ